MGRFNIFRRNGDLRLNSRTNTTISVTVAPNVPDLLSVAPLAHTLSIQQLIDDLGTSQAEGLSKNEALRRLERYGENLLQGDDKVSAWKVLIGQLGLSHFSVDLILILNIT